MKNRRRGFVLLSWIAFAALPRGSGTAPYASPALAAIPSASPALAAILSASPALATIPSASPALATVLSESPAPAAASSPSATSPSTPSPPAPTGAESAQALLGRILRRYGEYRDFQVRFVETAISRASGEGTPESGLVSFKRPEQWRWEYESPERKVVVVRGKIASIAIDGDPEVSRYDLGDEGRDSGVGSLLSGGERTAQSFSARFDPSGAEREPVLRLEPVRLSDEYDHVLIRVRREDLAIREVVVVDPGGNRLRFQFEGFRTDRGLPEGLFAIPAPPKAGPKPPP